MYGFIATVACLSGCFALTVTSPQSANGVSIGDFMSLTVNVDPSAVGGAWYRTDLSGNKVEVKLEVQPASSYFFMIFVVAEADLGYYVFRASDGQTEAENEPPITAYLTDNAPLIGTRTPIINAATGQGAKLHCDYIPKTVTFNPTVRWTKINTSGAATNIQITDMNKYSGGTIDHPTLIIMNIQESDFGTYKCTATNNHGGKSVDVILQKITGNNIVNSPSTKSTTEHVPTTPDFTQYVNVTTNSTDDSTYTKEYFETTTFNGTAGENTTMTENTTHHNTIDFESTTNASNLIEQNTTSNVTQIFVAESYTVTSEAPENVTTSNDTVDVTPDFIGTNTPPGSTSVNITKSYNISSFTSGITGETETNGSPSAVNTYRSSSVPPSTPGVLGLANRTLNNNMNLIEAGALCPCLCAYKERLDYWAAQNFTNYTMEELRIILRPILLKLDKELRVNKKNLSTTVRKLTSAKDNRPSVQSVGAFGLILILIPVLLLLLVDVTSVKQHLNNITQQGSLRITQVMKMLRGQKLQRKDLRTN